MGHIRGGMDIRDLPAQLKVPDFWVFPCGNQSLCEHVTMQVRSRRPRLRKPREQSHDIEIAAFALLVGGFENARFAREDTCRETPRRTHAWITRNSPHCREIVFQCADEAPSGAGYARQMGGIHGLVGNHHER